MSAPDSAASSVRSPRTVGEWFAQIEPTPPRALASELQRLLVQHAARPVSDVPEVCLETGERLLKELMSSGSTDRATALTLLSVDALVTSAFEAASHDAGSIESRAASAMQRIAALGEA